MPVPHYIRNIFHILTTLNRRIRKTRGKAWVFCRGILNEMGQFLEKKVGGPNMGPFEPPHRAESKKPAFVAGGGLCAMLWFIHQNSPLLI